MKVVCAEDIPVQTVEEAGASGVTVQWLISRPEGAPNFAMRLFELQPGGSTPQHSHAWEHEVFVLEGTAEVWSATGVSKTAAGSAVLVLPDEPHQFRNAGESALRFLCMIPLP